VGPLNFPSPVTTPTLRPLASSATPRQLPDHLVLPGPQLSISTRASPNETPWAASARRFVHAGWATVEERLGGDASHVETDAASACSARPTPRAGEIGGEERGGVAAGPDPSTISRIINARGGRPRNSGSLALSPLVASRGRSSLFRLRRSVGAGTSGRPGCHRPPRSRWTDSFRDLSADLHPHLRDRARRRRRDVHGRLVRLERDEGLLLSTLSPGFTRHFDHRHVLESPMSGRGLPSQQASCGHRPAARRGSVEPTRGGAVDHPVTQESERGAAGALELPSRSRRPRICALQTPRIATRER